MIGSDRREGKPGPVRVVLVVEDDPPIAQLLAGAINDEPGYVALRVGKGAEALRALAAVKADVVLPPPRAGDLSDGRC